MLLTSLAPLYPPRMRTPAANQKNTRMPYKMAVSSKHREKSTWSWQLLWFW